MAVREDWVRVTREIHESFSNLMRAIGSVRTVRRERRPKPRSVRLVFWAGRAETDAWFLAQLEQSKNRALVYYTKQQFR